MKIILISEGAKAGKTRQVSHSPVVMASMAILTVAVIAAGVLGYTLRAPIMSAEDAKDQAPKIESMKARLDEYKKIIDETRQKGESRFNAMAEQLALLQAKLMQVSVLGDRLSRAAGIHGEEMEFDVEPSVGGPAPAEPVSDSIIEDFNNTLDKLALDIDRKSEQLDVLSSLMIDQDLQADFEPSGWPVKGGYVSSRYGMRRDPFTKRKTFHSGVDIASPKGTPFTAMADGIVTFAGKRSGYGNMVEVDHGDGRSTRYGHSSALLVSKGDFVKKGQKLGLVGNTGRSTGPHLHFEVLVDNKQVNPTSYMQTQTAKN